MKVKGVIYILILLLLLPVNTSAATNDIQDLALKKTITFEDLGYTGDETLRGILVSRDFSVRWPNAWEVQAGNQLVLEFSHSSLLDDKSSLSVDWNGTRLASSLLSTETADHFTLKIDIPEDLISIGYNLLRIEVYMGIHEDYCEDIDNLAVWLTIHSTSYLDFFYNESKPELVDNSDLIENLVTIILPEKPNYGEIQGAARIAAKLGQIAAWRNLKINTLVAPTVNEVEGIENDIIVIGEYAKLKEYSFLTPPGGNGIILTSIGTIWIQESISSPSAVILVASGGDADAVTASASALANENVYIRLTGKRAFVRHLPDPKADKISYDKVFTFEELGYPDQTARGIIEQKVNYTLRLSMEWQVLTEGILDLHFAHSDLLDVEKSSLTVLVNDTPVGSFALTKENATDGLHSIKLPARLFKIGDNTISIATNIYLPHEYDNVTDCLEEFYSEAWLVIYSDSSITLPSGSSNTILTLSNYPVAFTGSDNLADLAFVIPDDPSELILQSVVQVSSGIGTYAEGEQLHPYVIGSSEAVEKTNLLPFQVLIGRPTQNKAILDLNESLPLKFQANSDIPAINEATSGIIPPEEYSGFIQATVNAEKHPRLVVTGTDDTGIKWASEELGSSSNFRSLKGDLVVLDGMGKAFAIDTYQEPKDIKIEEDEVAPTTNIVERSTPFWVLLISIGILGLSIIILLVVVLIELSKGKQKRDQHESIIQ